MSAVASVKLTAQGPVATLTIDNPPLNVLTVAIREELFERIAQVEGRTDLRVLVLEASGERAFSVGSHIGEFPKGELGGIAKIRFEQYLLDRLAALPVVTIAKVRGMALGGGGELMLACDLRIVSDEARIGFPEIRLGALPAAGGMKRLVQELGPARARELIFLGKPISAGRAAEIGLVNEVVPAARLDSRVAELAEELASLSAAAMRLAKRTVAAVAPAGLADTTEAEAFGALFRTPDLAEGLAAFLEKRPPRFNG